MNIRRRIKAIAEKLGWNVRIYAPDQFGQVEMEFFKDGTSWFRFLGVDDFWTLYNAADEIERIMQDQRDFGYANYKEMITLIDILPSLKQWDSGISRDSVQ